MLLPRALLVALLVVPMADVPAPVAMFRGGPAHHGVYASPSPTLREVAWRFETKGMILSSPAVAGDLVLIASRDGVLYAVDRATGAERWRFATEGPVASSPATAGGLVFISSLDGRIYGVDLATGTRRWAFATGGERRFTAPGIHGAIPRTELMADPFDVFLSSPTVVDGTVYIGSGDQHVYALDAATGTLRWRVRTGDVVHASPAVVDGTVYIGSWDRYLYALDARTGREQWRYATGIDTVDYNQVGIASSAAVADGIVFVGARDGHFHAVDAATGQARWTHDNHGGWTIGSPAVLDGVVYFATSDGRRFKGLDARTGAVRVDRANRSISFSSPSIAGGVVYYGTSDGHVHAFDIRRGEYVGEFQTDGSKARLAPWVDDSGVFRSGRMFPDRTLDGMMVGLRTTFSVGSVLSSPAIADGVLYVGSTDGTLYALR
ncbi:MAG: PQQ-binding-like beta-propeller repeat protein [Gemmatimonadetes bacterium]|nr:PQQ-binding-like beta-propeller repeat protein [Gemmatimonadota bacterium]